MFCPSLLGKAVHHAGQFLAQRVLWRVGLEMCGAWNSGWNQDALPCGYASHILAFLGLHLLCKIRGSKVMISIVQSSLSQKYWVTKASVLPDIWPLLCYGVHSTSGGWSPVDIQRNT